MVSCHNWLVNLAAEELETTPLGSAFRTWVPGLREWSGTYDCYLDGASVSSSPNTDYSLGNLHLGAVAASANFVIEDTAQDAELIGDIIITGAELSVNQGGSPNTINFTFRGSGGLKIVQAS